MGREWTRKKWCLEKTSEYKVVIEDMMDEEKYESAKNVN